MDQKINLDAQNRCGQTALHIACNNCKEQLVKMLLKAGADVNKADISGDCPIHYACKVRQKPYLNGNLRKIYIIEFK